jgi:hypothetical protein
MSSSVAHVWQSLPRYGTAILIEYEWNEYYEPSSWKSSKVLSEMNGVHVGGSNHTLATSEAYKYTSPLFYRGQFLPPVFGFRTKYMTHIGKAWWDTLFSSGTDRTMYPNKFSVLFIFYSKFWWRCEGFFIFILVALARPSHMKSCH